ncbi:hypothetical protein O0L34_g8620 [Tuta absoluta]|nr:hypothetical protein O0L34_g8620 [Tuta absoluta]
MTECKIMIEEERVEQVKEFVYLGSVFTSDGKCESDIERRVNAGNMVNGALHAFMNSQKVSDKQLSTANKDTPKNTTNNNSKKNNVNKKTKPTGKNQEEKLIVGSGSKPLQQEEILVITEQKIQELSEPDQEGWNKVVHQKSKRSIRKSAEIRRGTADPGFTTLQASEKVTYLHLYYVKVGTSDKQVSDHLKKICSGDVCTVDTLKARGNYASFKLGVPPRLVEEVLSTTNWATNICIRPWRQNFRVKQHNGERQSLNRH